MLLGLCGPGGQLGAQRVLGLKAHHGARVLG